MYKLNFIAVFTLLFAITACSQTKKSVNDRSAFKNVMIAGTIEGDVYGPCEPSICINPANPLQMAAGAVIDRYYWSHDGGLTWDAGKLESDYGVFGDPVVIADWRGNFYYAHLSDPDRDGWASEHLLDRIVIQKSTDGGKTYPTSSYTGMSHPKDQDKHWLCADPRTNALICTWTEFDSYNSERVETDRSRILFSRSDDGGSTWSAPVVVNQFEGDCLDGDNTPEGAVPAFGPKGEIYVAWSWNNKIWFDVSSDGGKTWLEQDIEVTDQPGGWSFDVAGIGRCNGMPILVCDLSSGPNRGALYINWSDQRNGNLDTDIFLCKSTDGGKTWSKALRVNDDPPGKQQFMSWMAIDQTDGHLYIVYYDRRNSKDPLSTEVFVAASQNGGKTFKNMLVSSSSFAPNCNETRVFFGDYNNISAHRGMVRPIWTRLDDKKLSVWTAIIDFKKPPIKDNDD